MARLDAGHTVALDDPIAAARFAAEEVEFWRDAGIYYFVPCVFEGGAIAVLALGRKDTDEPFNSEDLGAADGGRRPGGDGDRERPALPPAAPEGRRARPDARVQREHPRVARRRAGRVRRATSGSSAGTARSKRFYGVARDDGDRPHARRRVRRAVRRGARAPRAGSTRAARRCYRVPLHGAAPSDERRALLVNATAVPLQNAGGRRAPSSARSCSSRTSPTACGSKSSCRFPRRWRRSACWPPAWRTRSTRR